MLSSVPTLHEGRFGIFGSTAITAILQCFACTWLISCLSMRCGHDDELSRCVVGCSLRMIRRHLEQAVCPTRPRAHPLWHRQSLCQTAPRMCPPRPARHPARPPECSNSGASGKGAVSMARGRGEVPWAACSRSTRRSSLPG